MIITQTPLRISFFGGGTDFEDYYRQEEGCVLSSAIDKYIFVVIKERFDEQIRVGYSKTELVNSVDEVQHELVREALRLTGIEQGLEIATMADIPSAGSGLGSSSVVTVGLLNAMHTYLGTTKEHECLARQACEIEIERLHRPIGRQDQYIAAYGGLRFIRFAGSGITVDRVTLPDSQRRMLNQCLLLFYTNRTRQAMDILAEQKQNIQARLDVLRRMKAMAEQGRDYLMRGEFDDFGALLHEAWTQKKQLATRISDPQIDGMYEAARRAGALGGKITGAGGGGFLLLYCPRDRQPALRDALKEYRELPFHLERDGTKVIFNYRRSA
jgi:D-glycero-alpha-D-manno-heptose-7-phosphate kinase